MFSDRTQQWDYIVDSNPDSTYATADLTDATLENFFKRPIKTRSFTWSQGDVFFENFNPWIDFFENPRVINRITNFNLLRCKLKCRIVLNGNGFFYGRAIASYIPLWQDDDFTKNRLFYREDIVEASQRPHVYLNPTTSQGGTLVLPFFWYKNALRIPNQEWRSMGLMNIRSINELKHANGATDAITVSVFVWAEDVSLSIPTSNEPGALMPQMGTMDEYAKDGIISKPAAFVAKIAGTLTSIPPLAPYAKATQMAASALSNIAALFGYSRPAILEDIKPFRPTYLGNFSNTNLPDSVVKLTLDAKQETTVDSRVVGLAGIDEMTITSISCRESYLTSFLWATSASTETLLWNSEVNPVLWSVVNDFEAHLPACAFATLPFMQWRGTMRFRFQVVASAFHRGRLKIVYDPSYFLTNEYNTNYVYIVDLAQENDFSVEIGWGQEFSMVGHKSPFLVPPPYGSTPLGADPGLSANGIIAVYVVNELTSPSSIVNNDVLVNVFVSTGDDFEVFNPVGLPMADYAYFPDPTLTPQMGEADMPMDTMSTDLLAAPLSNVDHTVSVYYGDPITSFRQCLKRYNYSQSYFPPTGFLTVENYFSIGASDFPVYKGFAPSAYHVSTAGPFNYVKMTLLNWLTPAFAARRGALRWKYLRTGCTTDDLFYCIRGTSDTLAGAYQIRNRSNAGTSVSNRAAEAVAGTYTMWPGAHATNPAHNPTLEVELPWYSAERFTPARVAAPNIFAGPEGYRLHNLAGTWSISTGDFPAVHAFVSVGEDFNLAFFLGSPIIYFQETNPPAEQVSP